MERRHRHRTAPSASEAGSSASAALSEASELAGWRSRPHSPEPHCMTADPTVSPIPLHDRDDPINGVTTICAMMPARGEMSWSRGAVSGFTRPRPEVLYSRNCLYLSYQKYRIRVIIPKCCIHSHFVIDPSLPYVGSLTRHWPGGVFFRPTRYEDIRNSSKTNGTRE